MAGYSFARREDIEAVLKMIGKAPSRKLLPSAGVVQNGQILTSIIAKAPGGGIPARSTTTPGSATCAAYYIDTAGPTLTAIPDSGGVGVSVTVYHLGATAVAADAWITAKRVGTVWVADMEDCG